MSGYDGSRRNDDARFATRAHDDRQGMRVVDEEPYAGPPVMPAPGRDQNGNIEITTGQKMLSAVSGSLFTSLIGKGRDSRLNSVSSFTSSYLTIALQSPPSTSSVSVSNPNQTPPSTPPSQTSPVPPPSKASAPSPPT